MIERPQALACNEVHLTELNNIRRLLYLYY